MGSEFDGDRLSRGIDFMGIVWGQEVGGTNFFGTKCVAAEFILTNKHIRGEGVQKCLIMLT